MGDLDFSTTPSELRAVRADMRAPVSVSIRIAPHSVDRAIQRRFKDLDYWHTTFNNGVANMTGDAIKISTLSNAMFTRFVYRVVMMYVDIGTSAKTEIPQNRYLHFVVTDAVPKKGQDAAVAETFGSVRVRDVDNAVKGHEPRPRRWARRYATVAKLALESHTDHSSPLAVKWGFTPETRTVAFDFSDALPLSAVTSHQATAINNARAANTVQGGSTEPGQTSTHFIYHQGRVETSTTTPRFMGTGRTVG